ncbi:hypothetical protein ACFOKI_04110 [Sphingomonas qilianensis]|uniref:Uncharacterized protein n=1 Tax=Sphingomonas qilianensis TaxID=1736690 RepID=A0ABU9XTC5_9SPHN
MAKLLIVLLAGLTAASAAAQTSVGGIGMNAPNYSTDQPILDGLNAFPSAETPTMAKDKLERARALTVEAKSLLRQDGGTLTRQHDAYLRRKACDILGYNGKITGSLAPQRRCG